MLLLTGMVGAADPALRTLGNALLLVGAGVGLGYVFRSRSALPRRARSTFQRKVPPAAPSDAGDPGASLPPQPRVFLRRIAGLTPAQWRAVVGTARGSRALERPVDSSLDGVQVLMEKISWRRSAGQDDALVERFQRLVERTAEPERKHRTAECRRALDRLVDRGTMPFAPPFDEYRLALHALYAISFFDVFPDVCRTALNPFRSVLGADTVDDLCRFPVDPERT